MIDAEDEALNRWKASLGIGAGGGSIGDPDDKRPVFCLSYPRLPNPNLLSDFSH